MAPPVAVSIRAPAGLFLDDGFSTKIVFTADTDGDIAFWEKTVQPVGLDGGDAIETTTMHNTLWRTMAARSLLTATEMAVTAAYDPAVFDAILSLINNETTVTIIYPNSDTLAFYGYLQNFEPQTHEEGTQPEANLTIIATNTDPSDGSEAAPNYVSAAGTDTPVFTL